MLLLMMMLLLLMMMMMLSNPTANRTYRWFPHCRARAAVILNPCLSVGKNRKGVRPVQYA